MIQPCLMRERGCRAQADGQVVSCEGWAAADMVMTGFQLGWLAREAAEGAPGQLAELLRNGDPDLSICDAMGGRLYAALLSVYADYERVAPTNQSDTLTKDSKP
jgi:5,10-methenyltetrahydromethanopterin hydrogenase